jgi:putative transposase
MKNVRMVTKSVDPFRRARWTLPALHGALDEYFFEIKPTIIHPTLGMKPRDYEQMRILETGEREHIIIRFDENLLLMTSPHPPRRWHHRIDRKRGVWVGYTYFWNDEFRTVDKKRTYEVRVERWNANVVYVNLGARWVAAIARDVRPFAGRTNREVHVAIRAERTAAKNAARKDRLTTKNAKRMLGLWSPEKFDPRIGQQQREMEYLYSKLGMTAAMPDAIQSAQPAARTSVPEPRVDNVPTHQTNPPAATGSEPPPDEVSDTDKAEIWEGIDDFV